MADTLKNCPFCGSENISSNEVTGMREDGSFFHQTACLDCGAAGPMTLDGLESTADELWNIRTNDA